MEVYGKWLIEGKGFYNQGFMLVILVVNRFPPPQSENDHFQFFSSLPSGSLMSKGGYAQGP
jgi:hypothetical protein